MYCLYKKQSNWFWYFLANLVLLILIYQVTSPSNWRYGVHLLVGLSAPAGYLINEFWESSAVKGISHLATMVILVVALIQIFFSYRGIRSEHPRLSYETVSASKIKSAYSLPENDAVSYYNEAYAWHLDKEVLNFEELSCQKEVILIEDQPTRDFASLELQKLKNLYDLTELGRFWVDQGYYYKNKVYVEKAPVVLYLAKRVCR